MELPESGVVAAKVGKITRAIYSTFADHIHD